jgi:hypothetical protein
MSRRETLPGGHYFIRAGLRDLPAYEKLFLRDRQMCIYKGYLNPKRDP